MSNKDTEPLQNTVLDGAFSFLDPASDPEKLVKVNRENTPHANLMQSAFKELPGVLKLLGYDRLREGQDKAIYTLFSQRDTICILPTSWGKSSVYVIPTLCMKWKTLIFSPLVSLMKDQVESLWRMRLTAAQISSGQTDQENQMVQIWCGCVQFCL